MIFVGIAIATAIAFGLAEIVDRLTRIADILEKIKEAL